MFHDRKHSELMSSPDQVTAKYDGLQRHSRGRDIPDECVKVEFILTFIHNYSYYFIGA